MRSLHFLKHLSQWLHMPSQQSTGVIDSYPQSTSVCENEEKQVRQGIKGCRANDLPFGNDAPKICEMPSILRNPAEKHASHFRSMRDALESNASRPLSQEHLFCHQASALGVGASRSRSNTNPYQILHWLDDGFGSVPN